MDGINNAMEIQKVRSGSARTRMIVRRLTDGLAFLEQLQAPDGAWPSYVYGRRGSAHTDWNCFTAALVCESLSASFAGPSAPEELRDQGLRMQADGLVRRGLAFLQTCASRPECAYRFWPESGPHAVAQPGPDLD